MVAVAMTTFGAAGEQAVAAEIDLKSVAPAAETAKKKQSGAYVGVFGGQTTSQNAKMQLNNLNYDLQDKDGDFVMGLEVGYSWRTKYFVELGLEAEGLFSSTEINAVVNPGPGNGGKAAVISAGDVATVAVDLNYVAFMMNGTMNLDLRRLRPRLGRWVTRIRPYLGGGIGGAQIWARNQRLVTVGDALGTPAAATTTPFSMDEFVFAYQIFGGFEYSFTDKVSAYAEYRRLTFEKTEDLSELVTEMMLGGLRIRY